MTTYDLGHGRKVRTNATRRYLLVGWYKDSRPKVETSTNDQGDAARLLAKYRRDYPFSTWELLDQEGRWD